jgi:hypothetical protein
MVLRSSKSCESIKSADAHSAARLTFAVGLIFQQTHVISEPPNPRKRTLKALANRLPYGARYNLNGR